MHVPALILQLAIALIVVAQHEHAIAPWEYLGCFDVMEISFDHVVTFLDPHIPEQCQQSCQGHQITAVTFDGCRCVNSISHLPSLTLDESSCSNPCNSDSSFGFCGYASAGCYYANIYRAQDIQSVPETSTVILPPAAVTTCDSEIMLPPSQPDTSTITSICTGEPDIPDLKQPGGTLPSPTPIIDTACTPGIDPCPPPLLPSSGVEAGDYESPGSSLGQKGECQSTFVVSITKSTDRSGQMPCSESGWCTESPPSDYTGSTGSNVPPQSPSLDGHSHTEHHPPSDNEQPPLPPTIGRTETIQPTVIPTATIPADVPPTRDPENSSPTQEIVSTSSEPAVVTGGATHMAPGNLPLVLSVIGLLFMHATF